MALVVVLMSGWPGGWAGGRPPWSGPGLHWGVGWSGAAFPGHPGLRLALGGGLACALGGAAPCGAPSLPAPPRSRWGGVGCLRAPCCCRCVGLSGAWTVGGRRWDVAWSVPPPAASTEPTVSGGGGWVGWCIYVFIYLLFLFIYVFIYLFIF